MGEANETGNGGRPFVDAGRRAAERVGRMHFARALRKTAVPVFLGAGVILLGLRWQRIETGYELAAAGGIGVLWLLVCWCYGRAKRPGAFAALALWDEAAGRREAFASAEFFEESGTADRAGEGLHVQRSLEALREGEGRLAKELPLPAVWWVPAWPVALLALAWSPLLVPAPAAEELPLSEEMLAVAEEEAERLRKEREAFEKMEGMTEEERERAEELREALEATAEELAEAEGRSAEEVLSELEERAREAERLANELGDAGEEWASEEMLAEMREHVDTADLAEAIEDKAAGPAAAEAQKISDKLADEALTGEVRDRMAEAVGRTSKAATEEDAERATGKHFGKASEEFERLNVPGASTEFSELAKHFEKLEQREKAQEALEKLAEELREAGGNIAGQNSGGMEKLEGNEGQGAMEGVPEIDMPEGMQGGQGGELTEGQLPVPGLQNPMAPGALQDVPVLDGAPVPGTPGGVPGEGQPVAIVPGEAPEDGQPMMMLSAPIPGTKPGAIAAVVPGAGGQGGQPMAGGLQAGHGTTELGNAGGTESIAASKQGTVGAAINADGESTFRAVEGGTNDELATRGRREIAIDFINVQEEALDEQPLPLSRRNDVKRYFSRIRAQFEGE